MIDFKVTGQSLNFLDVANGTLISIVRAVQNLAENAVKLDANLKSTMKNANRQEGDTNCVQHSISQKMLRMVVYVIGVMRPDHIFLTRSIVHLIIWSINF